MFLPWHSHRCGDMEGGVCVCNPSCALNPLSSRASAQVCAGVSVRIFRPAEVERDCLVWRRETIAVLFICTERKCV